MGAYIFPLVLPRNASFCRTVLYPLQSTYHALKIYWIVVLCFTEQPPWGVEHRQGLRRPSCSFLLLPAGFAHADLKEVYTKASNGFLVPHYPAFCLASLVVLGRAGGVLKCLYFRALPWKCHTTFAAASHHREMWVTAVNTQKLAVFNSLAIQLNSYLHWPYFTAVS